MPDTAELKDTTAVVTGASSGIGLEVTRGLAAKGAHVVLAARSSERCQAAASAILGSTPDASLTVMQLDLADLASVHRFADELRARMESLDLLINNAGVASNTLRRTADGFELVFGTNHLGHFALTGLLLPAILASPKARVVTVTSMAHRNGEIDFDNLDGVKGYEPARAYGRSKLASVLFAYELQRRLTAAGGEQLSLACHPGWAATNMTVGPAAEPQSLQDKLLRLLARRFAPTAAEGARPVLFAAMSREVRGGDFIGPSGRFGVGGPPTEVRSSPRSYDEELARKLWQVSERLTGVSGGLATARPAQTATR